MSRVTKPFQTEDFLRLRDTWYERLEASGFEDIEKHLSKTPNTLLKQFAAFQFNEHDPDTYAAKQNYFYLAAHFLSSHSFEKEEHRQVWELHAAGLSFRRIAQALSTSKDRVELIVNKLKAQMKAQC